MASNSSSLSPASSRAIVSTTRSGSPASNSASIRSMNVGEAFHRSAVAGGQPSYTTSKSMFAVSSAAPKAQIPPDE